MCSTATKAFTYMMTFNPHKFPKDGIITPFLQRGSHILSNLSKVTQQKAVAPRVFNLRWPDSKVHFLSIILCCFSRTLEQKDKKYLIIKSTQILLQ